MARIAAMLSTPLPTLLSMPWDKALLWYPEASAIYKETWERLK